MNMPHHALRVEVIEPSNTNRHDKAQTPPVQDLALLHGWGFGKAAWQTVIPQLTPHFRLHLIELTGYGGTDERSTTPSNATQTAQALVDTLPKGCTLCGWSLGGMLALQAALLRPTHFSRLVLVGSTARFTQTDNWPHAQAPSLLDAFSAAVAENAPIALKRFAALLNQGDSQAHQCVRTLTKSQPITPAQNALQNGLNCLRTIDLRQDMGRLTVPSLIIHGAHDPLMPIAAAQCLKDALSNAQLKVFAQAAHAPFLNDPEYFATLITNFCYASAPN